MISFMYTALGDEIDIITKPKVGFVIALSSLLSV